MMNTDDRGSDRSDFVNAELYDDDLAGDFSAEELEAFEDLLFSEGAEQERTALVASLFHPDGTAGIATDDLSDEEVQQIVARLRQNLQADLRASAAAAGERTVTQDSMKLGAREFTLEPSRHGQNIVRIDGLKYRALKREWDGARAGGEPQLVRLVTKQGTFMAQLADFVDTRNESDFVPRLAAANSKAQEPLRTVLRTTVEGVGTIEVLAEGRDGTLYIRLPEAPERFP